MTFSTGNKCVDSDVSQIAKQSTHRGGRRQAREGATAQPAASHHPLFFQEPGWLLSLSQKEAANEDLESEAASLRAKVDSLETESLSLVAKITGAEAELSTCRGCVDNLRREVRRKGV